METGCEAQELHLNTCLCCPVFRLGLPGTGYQTSTRRTTPGEASEGVPRLHGPAAGPVGSPRPFLRGGVCEGRPRPYGTPLSQELLTAQEEPRDLRLLAKRAILSYSVGTGEEETKHWRPLPTCGRFEEEEAAGLEGEAGVLVSVRLPGVVFPCVV